MLKPDCLGVLLADDSRILRKAVTYLLESEPRIAIVGEAENLSQTVTMAAALRPAIVLLDLHMPDYEAFVPEFVKSQLRLCGSRVLGMSFWSCESEEARGLAESFGAVRLLEKGSFGDELIPAILWAGTLPSPHPLVEQEARSHELTPSIEGASVARGRKEPNTIGEVLDQLANDVLPAKFRRHSA
ncbi:MAG: response regulator [Terriglobales bacterium]